MKTGFIGFAAIAVAVAISGCSSGAKKAPGAPPASTDQKASAPAPIPQPQQKPEDKLTCKRGSEERTLTVEAVQPKGCKLHYMKFGNRSELASSSLGTDHCHSVRNRVKENLQAAGFACQ